VQNNTLQKRKYTIKGRVQKFPGTGGWYFVAVPKKYTAELKTKRVAWGMYPITAKLGKTEWKTKLMLLKGGDFFVALRADVRKKEFIKVNDTIAVSFTLV
jgi:hypothetical protein